jgi:acyl carrier protein
MPEHANDPFDALVDLVKQVQPALQGTTITRDQSVIDDLGLDSLDLVQLARRIGRDLGCDFDLDAWNSEAEVHGRSVGSIVDAVSAAAGA